MEEIVKLLIDSLVKQAIIQPKSSPASAFQMAIDRDCSNQPEEETDANNK